MPFKETPCEAKRERGEEVIFVDLVVKYNEMLDEAYTDVGMAFWRRLNSKYADLCNK